LFTLQRNGTRFSLPSPHRCPRSLITLTQLHVERTYLGSTLGSLEAWLLLRSLRTLHLRVPRQSATATLLAQWLSSIAKTEQGRCFDGVPGGILDKVTHSCLQGTDFRGFNPRDQMQGGWNATFALYVRLSPSPIHSSNLYHW
jgi:cystathionine gamma-synthase